MVGREEALAIVDNDLVARSNSLDDVDGDAGRPLPGRVLQQRAAEFGILVAAVAVVLRGGQGGEEEWWLRRTL